MDMDTAWHGRRLHLIPLVGVQRIFFRRGCDCQEERKHKQGLASNEFLLYMGEWWGDHGAFLGAVVRLQLWPSCLRWAECLCEGVYGEFIRGA